MEGLFGNFKWNFASYKKNLKKRGLYGDDDDRVRIR
jgi:hypothetical protein